ncbi:MULTISPECIES: hypothetical protein [unclassified Streptomyces]|uniref:hypothetical protein n=1 Tax=unclassified Streptomyces TaxID=2593676 RepID=UPI0036E4E805
MPSNDEARYVTLLSAIGFRCRPEPWNRTEASGGIPRRKLVVAPPVGARACNVHLRESAGARARYALLFSRLPARRRACPAGPGSVQGHCE